jgi:N-acetylglutamate synthase-like GNAT family acetyltransferase
MTVTALKVRRANVDDLPALRSLWLNLQWDAAALESRLTEFQIVENNGAFAGAIGVQLRQTSVLLHSEDYPDFAVADAARELFWERIQKLASNHGAFRVWTQEASPFWTRWGFQPVTEEIFQRLPDEWKPLAGKWFTLELKNEDAIKAALGNQFAGFMASEKQQTEQVAAQARKFTHFIAALGFLIGIVGISIAAYLFIHLKSAGR